MMYTDSKLEVETSSDSDWDEMTAQPEIVQSTASDQTSILKHKQQVQPTPRQDHSEVEKPPFTDPIERKSNPKFESETKQLGISKTVPKLSHAVPTPPALSRPRQGRRRQERSVDPPYEFSSLTAEETDTLALSKAVSAPLKSSKYHQYQVADKSRTLVHKRDSWDEVSELPEDNIQTSLVGKSKDTTGDKDIHSPAVGTEHGLITGVSRSKPNQFIEEGSTESTRCDAGNAETFTIQEPAKHQPLFLPQSQPSHHIQTANSLQSPLSFSLKPHFPPQKSSHSVKRIEGVYHFEEMNSDHVDYEQDLPEAYMMKLAQRFERKLQRFWQEVFGCLRLFCSFFTFFFIECVRFCLRHVFQKLCIGILLAIADHIWKPCLQCCYNGCLLPGCVLCANSCASLVQVFRPILRCSTSLLRELSKCCSNVRFCEVINPYSHPEYKRLNTHVI